VPAVFSLFYAAASAVFFIILCLCSGGVFSFSTSCDRRAIIMGIDSGSTNRWKTARERNRLKARFEIQSRVAELVEKKSGRGSGEQFGGDQSSNTSDSKSSFVKSDSEHSSRSAAAASLDEANIILKYLQAIIKNDVSTFSVTSLARHQNDIRQYQLVNGPLPNYTSSAQIDSEVGDSTSFVDLSSGIPKNGAATVEQAEYALRMMISTNIPWRKDNGATRIHLEQSQPSTLATSKYGREYVTKRLIPYMNYLQSCGDNLTLMEYASLVGRHQIVGLLLLGGVDPTKMRLVPTENNKAEKVIEHYKRGGEMARRKVLSFFHCLHTNEGQEQHQQQQWGDWKNEFDSGPSVKIPMSIWQYMIRAVVEMRINGALNSVEGYTENYCSLCNTQHQSCHERSQILVLKFGPPCNHSFCEPCIWVHLLQHAPNCTNLKSKLVTCPVCSAEFSGFACCEKGDLNHTRQKEEETSSTKIDGNNGSDIIIEEKKDDGSTATTVSIQQREQRRFQSYSKFMALPATSTELKLQSRKKDESKQYSNPQKFNCKRRKEKDPIHSTWEEALKPLLEAQQSRDVRSDRFFRAVVSSSVQLVIIYLNAGVNVDIQNEYGQTPLYIACLKGSVDVVRWLLHFGADVSINANGGSSCYSVARRFGRVDVMELLLQYHDQPIPIGHELSAPCCDNDSFEVTTLIDQNANHPGAGACVVDNALSEEQLCFLDSLQQSLPVIEACDEELGGKKSGGTESLSDSDKSIYRPSRSYYCDVDNSLQKMLEGCILAARQSLSREEENQNDNTTLMSESPKSVFQHIRFLKYERKGGVLPPHVDLCRVDEKSGKRSTHTFILYLTDCDQGGGTALLHHLKNPRVLAVAQPKRGRALLFPHNCPHSGLEVDCVPKVLLRGEVIL
jgi:hypothetical protein